jgi:FtsH-binding integral membrane protein
MRYAKAVIATLVAIGAALVTALGTSPQQNLSHLDTRTWLVAIGAILASGAITWWTENVSGLAGGIIKAVVASAGAFITALVTAYADNIVTQAELIGAISAGLLALAAVYQVKNTG